jgi:hypothetical protein
MVRKKVKVLIALSISSSLLLSQVAMAETAVSAQTVTVRAAAQEVQKSPQDEIKTKISKDDALKIIKKFKFAEGYEVSNISLQNNSEINQPMWRMDLFTGQYTDNISISISAETGELVNYYSWQQQSSKKNIVTINSKKAREISDKFIADYIKTDSKNLEFIPNQYNSYERYAGIYEIPQYSFTYALKVNGIVTSDANYNISINAANGKVSNFNSPYEYLKETKYPSKDGVKDLDKLKDKYTSLLNMQLQYLITYGNDNKPKVNLAYTPTTPGMLDAKTMDIVEDYINYNGNQFPQSVKYQPIVPDAKVVKNEINEENALEIIKNAKTYIENLVGFKFEDSKDMYNEGYSINLNASKNEVGRNYNFRSDNKNYGLSMTLNLSTGNIASCSFYSYVNQTIIDGKNVDKKEVKEKVNYKEAKKISDEIIKTLFPKQYGVYSDNNQEPDSLKDIIKLQPVHNFQYSRFENGIPVGNVISVGIDKETGLPSQIYMNWIDIDFPKADNVISPEEAKKVYLKDTEMSLEYYTPYISSITKNAQIDRAPESVIVFKPTNNAMYKYIDAKTGKIMDYAGMPIQTSYVDESHWASDSIQMLEAQGVSINNISNYDEKLSRQDVVKMLSQIMGTQYFNNSGSEKKDSFSDVNKKNEYYRYIESAVQNGIIEATGSEFKGTQKITKGEFVVMLVDMLGYKEIAKHDEIFSKSDGNIFVSICKALDILPVKTGEKYDSMDNITFAEAAYSLQKSLKYFR